MDELPIGGGNKGMFSPENEQAPTATQQPNPDEGKPLEERMVSKAWATRKEAFEELRLKIVDFPVDCANETIQMHSGKWAAPYLNEVNPGALEKILDCFEAYLKKASSEVVSSLMVPVLKPMIEKCLSHAKASIKAKAGECMMLVFEASENFGEEIIDALIAQCKSPKPKISLTALALLANLMLAFGVKRFSPAKFGKLIESAANSSGPGMRAESMNCYKAIFRWVGQAGVEPMIQPLKQAQKDALQKDFDELKSNKDSFKRKTRSEAVAAEEAAKDAAINAAIGAEEEKKDEEEEIIDAFDISAPQEILSKFPADWITETLAIKKWDVKRDKLIEVQTAANVPKLQPGDYQGLSEGLKKMAADNHAVVSQNAIKAIGYLSKGLRQGFHDQALSAVPILFVKCKEKRIIEDVFATLEHIHTHSVSLNEMLEPLTQALKKEKALIAKQNMAVFLEKAIKCTYIDQLEEIATETIKVTLLVCEEKDEKIREQGLTVFGLLMARLPESHTSSHVKNFNSQKMQKVTAAKEAYKLSKFDRSEKKAKAKKAAEEKKAAATPKQAAPPLKKKQPASMVIDLNAASESVADESMGNDDSKGSSMIIDSMNEGVPKKARKAPPSLGQKPAAASAAATSDDKPKVGGGPPARLANRAPAKTAGGSAKVVKAEDIKSEEVGAGLGKEEAIEKVKEFYAADITQKFEEAKWQDKVQGYAGLKTAIEEQKPDQKVVEATCKFIKAKMKDWKESNLNLMKEAIFTFQTMASNCENVPKRALRCYMPFLGEKIGDIKMSTPIKELLLNLAEFMGAKFVSLEVIKHGLTTKAPNNIKEACNFVCALTEDFGAGKIGIKEAIDFSIYCANHANKAVRDASMALLKVIYQHLGDAARNFLTDIKASTLALIEDEFAKITPYKRGEFQPKRSLRGEAAEEEAAQPASAKNADPLASLEDALPREDISKQLNAKLLKLFSEKDWKQKVKGCEQVNNILKEAKMRIKPDGIGDLIECLKQGLKESNKAVLKAIILTLGAMAEATGSGITKYTKKCLNPLLIYLGDKAALMRADVLATAEKWAEAIGSELVMNLMCGYLSDGNPELRENSLAFMLSHKEDIQKMEHAAMYKPLIACLTDRSGKIRTLAEQVIVIVMGFTGAGPFTSGIKDLKPAVQNSVRPLLEKAKGKCIAAGGTADVHMEETKEETKQTEPAAARNKVTLNGGGAAKKPTGPQLKPEFAAKAAELALQQQKNNEKSPSKGTNPTPASSSSLSRPKTAASRINSAAPPKEAPLFQEEEEMFVCNPGNKERRAQLDSRSKWLHDDIKPEHVEKVKQSCEQIFGQETSKNMFSTDFKKHVAVIGKFVQMIDQQPQNLMESLDVIIKWSFIKLSESSNTTFAVNVYDFYTTLFSFLISQEYVLWEHEAYVVIPLFCDKVGVNNAILKPKIKNLISLAFKLHDQRKVLNLIIKFGGQNKNQKSAAESLDAISTFLATNGLDALGDAQVKVIARLADASDKGVREGALQVLGEVYKILDEDVWRIIGNVPIKVKGLLEQRFRKVKGLGQSSSNVNLGGSIRNPVAASPRTGLTKQNAALTKSFSSAQKLNQSMTPRSGNPLRFQNSTMNQGRPSQEPGSTVQQQQQSGNLTRSFKAQQQLNSSIRSGGGGAASQSKLARPQTAANMRLSQQNRLGGETRQTVPMRNNEGMFDGDMDEAQMRKTDLPNFYPNQNRDDDEDLLDGNGATTNQEKEEEVLDAETQQQVNDILGHIKNLKYSSELGKRVESLIALNEVIQGIQKYQKGLARTANQIIGAFTHVLIDIFDRPKEDMPLRFAKYFVSIVNKTCSCTEIMQMVKEQEIYDLVEQLLTRLLIDDLDKLGEDKEGEFILKNLNASMLRCLENCNRTSIFCVLFNLLRRYKSIATQPKVPGLIIKCLLKLSKILEKVIDELEIERVLIVIHLYLISIDHERKTSNDEMGIRIVKTLVHEMVKVKKHSVLDSYKIVQRHDVEDKHLYRWIKIILNHSGSAAESNSAETAKQEEKARQLQIDPQKEISTIISELKSTDKFQQAIPKLNAFLAQNKSIKIDSILSDLSPHFRDMILAGLDDYRKSLPQPSSNQAQSGFAKSTPNERPSSAFGQKVATPEQNRNLQSSDSKPRFGFRSSQSGTNSAVGLSQSAVHQSKDLSQQSADKQGAEQYSSGLRLPRTSQPAAAAKRTDETSKDRISAYQSKLSTMREKFQQRKSLGNSQMMQNQLGSGVGGTGGMAKHNSAMQSQKSLNTSFSAMNSSLTAKWSAISKSKNTGATRASETQALNQQAAGSGQNIEQSQSVAGMTAGGVGSNQDTGGQQVSSSSAAVADNGKSLTLSQNQALQQRLSQGGGGGEQAGASNQDLNRRLQEMKAKLAALKKN